jgi:hypothetical protein
MSGVIDEDGTQWEHCNICGDFEKIGELRYEQPSERFPHGRDVCRGCAKLIDRPGALAKRVARIKKKLKARDEIIRQTTFPTVCGHGTKLGQGVYRFFNFDGSPMIPGAPEDPRGVTAKIYCSEECANVPSH